VVSLLFVPSEREAAPRTPVLVELFTSEGCSSCPPADALIARLVRDQPVTDIEVVALAWHVDYWDHQGWKDRFASKAFTARQDRYAKALGVSTVYTPQLVVDGRREMNGSDEAAVRRALGAVDIRGRLLLKVDARVRNASVRLSIDLPAAPAGAEPVEAFVALAEDDLTSVVRAGENSGRTLTHVAVVRSLDTLGSLEPDAFVADGQLRLDRTWRTDRMRAIAWLQGRRTGHIYGVAAAPLLQ
jgi:hypothetical protein